MTQPSELPGPVITSLNQPLYEAARRGILSLQRTGCTGVILFPPRAVCPKCLRADDLTWVDCSGSGSIYSWTQVYRPQHPAFFPQVPITLVAVRLDEGPMIIARLEGGEPRIDARVRAAFTKDDPNLLVFALAPTSENSSHMEMN